jgi:predicted nuclease of predicted toxin-antitoxin system
VRLLVDNALSPDVARGLSDAGHDAIHARDIGLGSAADPVIFDRAAAEDRIVISADTDFGTLLAVRQASQPSVVLFRGATPRRPADQVTLLLANLPQVEGDLLAGAIVVIEPARLRVRSLPIFGSP